MRLGRGSRQAREPQDVPDHDCLVRWDAVSRRYDTHDGAGLAPTSLTVRRGDYISIVGPSGAGKSTLLNLLGLIDSPTSGRRQQWGVDLESLSEPRLAALRSRRVAFVFQSFHLLDSRSVLENVALALVYRGVPRARRLADAADALEQVGLTHRADKPAETLSGGERQRAAVARALVSRPDLLLCDEPTGNLDADNAGQVLALLRQVHALGTTVVVVTHDDRAAAEASSCWRIEQGVLTVQDRP